MTENTWRRGQKSSYTGRPLTDNEREFAGLIENHDLIYKYCNINRLDFSEWYDILIIPYLEAVKKYVTEQPECQQYSFQTVLFLKLNTAIKNYNRAMHRKKRMPDGGIFSLDATIEGDNSFSEYNNHEAWFEDKTVDILQDLIDDENEKLYPERFEEMFRYLTERCNRKEWGAKEFKTIVEMLIEGYSRKQALKDVNRGKERRKGVGCRGDKRYTFTYIFDEYEENDLDYDLKEFREVFRKIFGC